MFPYPAPKGRTDTLQLSYIPQMLAEYIQCGGCLVWWMSYFTHGVVDVWCGGCLVWWMSGVVDVWCGGCLILHTVWWMSGVVDVCVVDVVQSIFSKYNQVKVFHSRDVRKSLERCMV